MARHGRSRYGRHRHRHGPGATGGYGGNLAIGNVAVPFISGTTLSYYGPAGGFLVQLHRLTPEEKGAIKTMNIELYGEKAQDFRGWILCLIITLGVFLIIPLFFLCCIQKYVYERRVLNAEAYAAVDGIICESPNLEILNVSVADSCFDANKAMLLQRNLLNCRKLMFFKFNNLMGQYDTLAREYSDFPLYFSQIKAANKFIYTIQWGLNIQISRTPGANMITAANMSNLNLNNVNMTAFSPRTMLTPNMNQYPALTPNPIATPLVGAPY